MAELNDLIYHFSNDGLNINVYIRPLVKCKECIHFEPFRPTDGFCKISGMINTLDFFCADGERRDPCSSQDS